MLAFGRRAKWLGLAAVLLASVAVYVILITRPLTPERARAALAERYPDLRDAPTVVRPDGTFLIGDCWCNPVTERYDFYPPRPFLFGNRPAGIFGGAFLRRVPFGSWEVSTMVRFRCSYQE
ncbi:hypothetical protein [Gemmata sp.]|uniref:hypothetical protein n=1 Tax=Gemmata sp. TaxID=1914242 RepID=UPI003F702339